MIAEPELHQSLTTADPDQFVELLFGYIRDKGQSHYDEVVTQIEHALQCAALAKEEDGSDEMIVSALLHDLGHLLVDEHADEGTFLEEDMWHESAAAEFLGTFFPPIVIQPILHHVAAKRYLCTIDPAYHDGLSPASKRSLALQGGTLSDEERTEMEANPYLDQIVALRRWDDRAKVSELDVPGLESYADNIKRILRTEQA